LTKDQLFAFLFAPANRECIKPEWITSYYSFDQERALREAPYFVAAPLEQRPIGSVEDLDSHGTPRIFAYGEDAPRLLDTGVMVFVDTLIYEQGKPPRTGESEF